MSGAPLPKAESLVLTSDEVNYLIYRYLQEGGEQEGKRSSPFRLT